MHNHNLAQCTYAGRMQLAPGGLIFVTLPCGDLAYRCFFICLVRVVTLWYDCDKYYFSVIAELFLRILSSISFILFGDINKQISIFSTKTQPHNNLPPHYFHNFFIDNMYETLTIKMNQNITLPQSGN